MSLPEYLATVSKLAEQFGTYHLCYHRMFQELLAQHPPERFAPEPVHPSRSGHLLMAYEWLRVMGF